MINCEKFYKLLLSKNINFFTGVPDSLLKDFCSYVMDNAGVDHVISPNEGNAIALAAGHYLASGNIGLVYMQNSGLGNTINPLVSLVDPEVYNIPVLLLIGWRGEPGVKDEPQHIKQGKVTTGLLKTLSIPYDILPSSIKNAKVSLNKAFKYMSKNNAPYALVVKKDTFEKYSLKKEIKNNYSLSREDAIKCVVDLLSPKDIVISTTGKASRELFEYRDYLKQGHEKDFLTVGSMGHSSQIALGIALEKRNRKIFCLDGDGAMIMHMGSLAAIGSTSPKNFYHIILNNGSYESVGGQPTFGYDINIQMISKACGYRNVYLAKTKDEIKKKINLFKKSVGPSLLEIRTNSTSRENLGRPSICPVNNKKDFIKFVRNIK
jgi:phosphonopyruvate decarboxylase